MGSGRPTIISLYICRTNASEKIMVFLHAKGIYCGPTKSLFRKYIWQTGSDWDEIYTKTSVRVARSPANFISLHQIGTKLHLRTFCHQSNASFHPALPGGRFLWNLNTKRELVSSWFFFGTVCEILPIKNHLPVNLSFGFLSTYFRCACSSHCL